MRLRWAGLVLLAACSEPPRVRTVTPTATPAEVCADPTLDDDDICVMSDLQMHRLAVDPFEVLEVVPAPGTTPAKKIIVRADGRALPLKWRATALGAEDAFNNSPRRELATLAVARMLLGADQTLVPPSTLRCVHPKQHPTLALDHPPTFGDECVLGVITAWIDNVEEIEVLWDPERYEEDAAYRIAVAELNVLARLVDHRDSHSRNTLVDDDDDPTRIFLVDNSLAFSGLFNPLVRWFGVDRDWAAPVVPRLPSSVAARLRSLRLEELDRLATVAELRKTTGGWRLVRPVGPQADQSPPVDDEFGIRRRGPLVQLGLTRTEINDVKARLERLRPR